MLTSYSSNMDSNQIHPKIKDVLAKNSNVGVVVTKNPSVDHMAAGLSLFLSLRQMGKTSVIASPTAPTVEVASLVGDRKSTRLNSSHQIISYAVFCLKKKKTRATRHATNRCA